MLTKEKKQQLIQDSESWWNHTLKRPIIQVTLSDKEKELHTRGELLDMLYDFNVPIDKVVKSYAESYQSNTYLGDAFPNFYMRSTGVLGAYLGQGYKIDKEHGTIWFQELKGKELEDIQVTLTDDIPLYKRSLELIKGFQEYFKDDLALGIANLGGMMDIVESMRGANNSLMDLYDDPDEVLRLNADIFTAYKKAYLEMIDIIDPKKSLGYTGWITLLSQKPYFISQCDFCCMIGYDQFDEFIYETLKKEVELIERSFYHLDGPGAVKHLESIIDCGFKGIQWINGAGAAPLDDPCWNSLYQKVKEAGILLQVYCYNADELRFIDHIVNIFGTTEKLAFICTGDVKEQEKFETYLQKYNIPK
ncbi:MAG: hypothetical protein ACK5LC_07015 [Coprobacillaceae bacterium]